MTSDLPRDTERRAERHLMLDLETLGRVPTSAPFAIGAVPFDVYTGTLGKPFFMLINPLDAMRQGMQVTQDVIKFWKDDASPEARAYLEAAYEEGFPLKTALEHFARYIAAEVGPTETVRLWGKGADFDKPILDVAYTICDIALPWGARAARCYRTLEAFMPVMPPRRTLTGTAHHAVDDALHQATLSIQALRHLYGLAPLDQPVPVPPASPWVSDPLQPGSQEIVEPVTPEPERRRRRP
jgi:hypothetical protein